MIYSVPYTAYINYTGDVQIEVNGETYFDFDDIYCQLDNHDIVYEDAQVTTLVGSMTVDQFNQLRTAQ